jgi:hypothetical protein
LFCFLRTTRSLNSNLHNVENSAMTTHDGDEIVADQPATPANDRTTAADSAAPVERPGGLQAGPLWMTLTGLLVGFIAWSLLANAYPIFQSPPSPDAYRMGPPSPADMAGLDAQRLNDDMKNILVVGLAVAALAGFAFATVEWAAARRSWSGLAHIVLAVILAAGLGALAGYAAQSLLLAWRFDRSIEPMQRTIAAQGVFWVVLAAGVGIGAGLFARRFLLLAATALQAIMSMVLFVLLYVPLAGYLFPLDDAERIVPASIAHRGVWVVPALALIGLFLGLARRRQPRAA